MFSKIIKNGTVVDGKGGKPFTADIAIEGDKIVKVGNLADAKTEQVIDATGKYVTPGFVDIQNHSDVYWTIFDNPSLDSLLAQGITTALIGNCGASLAPLLSHQALYSIQKWHNLEGVNFNWLTFEEYMQELGKHRFGINLASLVGYSTLRRGLIADNIRSLTDQEIRTLANVLDESMEAGAFGLSNGLSYAHEAIISETELVSLAQIVKKRNGLLSVHLRSEAAELTESVAESLELVNKLSVNLKISHLKARNKNNWHLLPHALNLIEEIYQKRGHVHFDVYPYDFVWQVLYIYLPRWAYEGGRQAMLHHLKDPSQRNKILAYLASRDTDYSQIYITSTSMPLNVVGKSLGEIARRQNVSSEQALLTVIENGGPEILVFDRNLNDTQVEQLMAHSLSIIATDGAGYSSAGSASSLVHPRCFGSMPKFLSMVLEKNIMPFEKAIQKITNTPAEKIGLHRRGRIETDYYADLVIMDAGIGSYASYMNPYMFPEGIHYVLVNGEIAMAGSDLAGLWGTVLRKTK